MGVNKEEISTTIIELEKSFNERWSVGDNRGYLDAFAEEVSYFDPILENILVGRDKVIAWIDSIYSNPHIVRSEYLNPQVHVSDNGDLAVLGYNLNTFVLDESGEEKLRWNFREAWPTKWTGPSFNATGNEVAIETLEIAHEGLELQE